MKSFPNLVCCCVLLYVSTGAALGQQVMRPTPPAVRSCFVVCREEFNGRFEDWTRYNLMHVDREKLLARLAEAPPAGHIQVYQCAGGAGLDRQTARTFAPYAECYTYYAFLHTSEHGPADGELRWGGLDNPYVNHLRDMREIAGTTAIVGLAQAGVGGRGGRRPAVLEEVQWQFVAAMGVGYRGLVWPVPYTDPAWGKDLKRISDHFRKYGQPLARARPVAWARVGEEGPPLSAAACDDHLFVFLLHPAYMTFGPDAKTVTAPLDKPICAGSLTLDLPKGLTVRRGQTLSGTALRLRRRSDQTTTTFRFRTGGQMLIFALSGTAESTGDSCPATENPIDPEAGGGDARDGQAAEEDAASTEDDSPTDTTTPPATEANTEEGDPTEAGADETDTHMTASAEDEQ